MTIERRKQPRHHEPLDELIGLLWAARAGRLPTGLWGRLTPGEAITLSNAVSNQKRPG